jgi:hypothetical protein
MICESKYSIRAGSSLLTCTHTRMIQEATEAASHCAFPGQEMVNSLCGSARTPAPPEPSMYLAPSQLFVTSRTAVASENSRLRMQVCNVFPLSPFRLHLPDLDMLTNTAGEGGGGAKYIAGKAAELGRGAGQE